MSSKYYEKHKALLQETLQKQGVGLFIRKQSEYTGLLNQGATCYLNSLLQLLFHNKKFREAVFRSGSNAPIAKEFQSLFAKMQFSVTAAVSTKQLTAAFGWNNSAVFEQSDVHELFSVLADALCQICPVMKTFMSDFEGMLFPLAK